jgi:hypothetical protein
VDTFDLLALRHRVSDSTLLDWAELEQLLPPRPCRIRVAELRRLWRCSQPTVSRRITRLWDAGLLDYRAGSGWYRVRRLGPLPQKPDRVPGADQENDAHDSAHHRDPDLVIADRGVDDVPNLLLIHGRRVAGDAGAGCS